MSEAGGLEAEYQDRISQGGMFLEIMTENLDTEVPSVDDLAQWAGDYGLTMPVLSDADGIMWQFATSGSVGYPYTVLLDRGEVVTSVGSASTGEMDELLGGGDTGGQDSSF